MNIQNAIKRPVVRLTASYLAVIMTMSIGFSAVFYMTSARELDRRPTSSYYENYPHDIDRSIDQWLRERSESGRLSLAVNLVLLNSVTLLLGSAISYMLARKTLRPIEEAMAAQDRFIADASHELRTPLTGLLLDNEVTLRKKSLTAKDARMAMERNVQGLTKLKDLSDTLLDLVARQQKNAPRTVVSVEQIVRSAVSQVAPMANKKHITFVQNIANNTLTIDEAKLTKLLVILYDNAIKYSKPHTTVTLSSESVGSDILLTVHDQGIGMSHEEKEHIFDRLYRADASRSHGDGYGLGLAIARKLAHDLNGSIAVQSEPGHGSTFTVRLPRS